MILQLGIALYIQARGRTMRFLLGQAGRIDCIEALIKGKL
jgi:hypothetical protein